VGGAQPDQVTPSSSGTAFIICIVCLIHKLRIQI
jgi:hypothetical protein